MKVAFYLAGIAIVLIAASAAIPAIHFSLFSLSAYIKPWLLLLVVALLSAAAAWLAARRIYKKAGSILPPAHEAPQGSSLSPEDQDYLNLS